MAVICVDFKTKCALTNSGDALIVCVNAGEWMETIVSLPAQRSLVKFE